MTDDQTDDPYLGRHITDQVVLTERLGAGAMGMVFRARHQGTQSDVVVKILAPYLASEPEIQERFASEAVAVNMAQHPNVVRVWDVGESGDLHYVIMEYLDGITLADLFETQLPDMAHQTPADTARILALLGQAAQALAAIHDVGVVHRDIKPENMMVVGRRVGAGETLKLLDFGLAKTSAGATLDGVTMGTADYMPPEQIFSAAETDSAADVYALGTILYEALVGDTPFELPELPRRPEVDEYVAVWTAFKEEKRAGPPPLPESVPPTLRRLIETMLAGDPQQRPSASQVAAELEAFHLDQNKRKLLGELRQWMDQGQRSEDLLRGSALEEAIAAVDDVGDLDNDLQHFLLSSERREAPRRRRRARRLLGASLGVTALLLLATVSLAFGYSQSRRAKRSTRVAKRAQAEKQACGQELVRLADDANQLTKDVAKSKTELGQAETQVNKLAADVKQGRATEAQLSKAVARLKKIRLRYVHKQRKAKKANAKLQKLSAGLKKELQACVTEQKRCVDRRKGLGKQLKSCQTAKSAETSARTTCEKSLGGCTQSKATCDKGLATCTTSRTTCQKDLTTCAGERTALGKKAAACKTARDVCDKKSKACAANSTAASKGLSTCKTQLASHKTCASERGACRKQLSGCTRKQATCQANLRACRSAPQPATP